MEKNGCTPTAAQAQIFVLPKHGTVALMLRHLAAKRDLAGCNVRSYLGAWRRAGALAAMLLATVGPVRAHPHVFIDGGIDFVVQDGSVLEALQITWRYDAFESLYVLASEGFSLNENGQLAETARQELVRLRKDLPEEIGGSAHLKVDGEAIDLDWPTELDAQLADGRLELTFTRRLETPVPLADRNVEVAFYESTYFYEFNLTQEPKIFGNGDECAADLIPFNPDLQLAALQATLAKLSREETPEAENVGALFADWILLTCD